MIPKKTKLNQDAKGIVKQIDGLPQKYSCYLTILIILIYLITETLPSFAQQQKIDSLFSVLKTTKTDSNRVKILYNISDLYSYTDPEKAIEYCNQGLSLSNKIAYNSGVEKFMFLLGNTYCHISEYDTALIYYDKLKILLNEKKDTKETAKLYNNIGLVYLHQGKIDEALELIEKSNSIYINLNEKSLIANGFTIIGTIYENQGDFTGALENYLKAKKIYEDENYEDEVGVTLLSLSSIYRCLKQFEKAKSYAFEAIIKLEKVKDLNGVGTSYYKLALIYAEEKDLNKSNYYLSKASKVFEETKNTYYSSIVMMMLGCNFDDNGILDSALIYYNYALATAQQTNEIQLISALLGNIGIVYLGKSDYQKALEYMYRSEKLINEINDKNLLLNITQSLLEVFSHMNRSDSVLKYFSRYQVLSDSIYGEQIRNSIAEMQTKYETEKKEKEIVSLNYESEKKSRLIVYSIVCFTVVFVFLILGFYSYKNRKSKEQAILNRQITESGMKALRAQMNPHFIFNCVHTIEQLLNDLKIEESKTSLYRFSNLTRRVLENSQKREIPLTEEIETLKLYMELENLRFKQPFTYSILVQQGIDPEITLIPPLILQPFVENAIKHGFSGIDRPGSLTIDIRNENQFLICIVEDNGVGRLSASTIKQVAGFKKESIGMQLTEERLRLISGMKNFACDLMIDDLTDLNNIPSGTRVKMFLPYELSI